MAQDRVVARRMRALLERAQVFVADETGWKLSTTRAAAALAAWFELVSSRAETMALLDFLKSPFLFPELGDKSAQVMTIERALRRANVLGGWAAAANALSAAPAEQALLRQIAQQAGLFARSRTLAAWIETTCGMLEALGMRAALEGDAAGQQVWALLETLAEECAGVAEPFSAAEWRAFVSLQLEETAFVAPNIDARVVMLPLNGARLRSFDAVLVVGADARHLPSQPNETLFFANAVRARAGAGDAGKPPAAAVARLHRTAADQSTGGAVMAGASEWRAESGQRMGRAAGTDAGAGRRQPFAAASGGASAAGADPAAAGDAGAGGSATSRR